MVEDLKEKRPSDACRWYWAYTEHGCNYRACVPLAGDILMELTSKRHLICFYVTSWVLLFLKNKNRTSQYFMIRLKCDLTKTPYRYLFIFESIFIFLRLPPQSWLIHWVCATSGMPRSYFEGIIPLHAMSSPVLGTLAPKYSCFPPPGSPPVWSALKFVPGQPWFGLRPGRWFQTCPADQSPGNMNLLRTSLPFPFRKKRIGGWFPPLFLGISSEVP